jgi:hypothetical protein
MENLSPIIVAHNQDKLDALQAQLDTMQTKLAIATNALLQIRVFTSNKTADKALKQISELDKAMGEGGES